jgi:transcriptional regulator with XRE-family HTH domain
MADRRSLGAFLRSRRDRADPASAGIKTSPRRRVPGLRREELAHLAGISAEYYQRLEQGRAHHPAHRPWVAVSLPSISKRAQASGDPPRHQPRRIVPRRRRRGIENWIKLYNERRLHSALGYQTPAEMRRAWEKRMAAAV